MAHPLRLYLSREGWVSYSPRTPRNEVSIPSRGPKLDPVLAAQQESNEEDLLCLLEIGKLLNSPKLPVDEEPLIIYLARALLRIRDRFSIERPLVANPAQQAFERDRTTGNIVLKARQMGITTWIAGRFFLKTITSAGALTVLVAHTREAAEAIFMIVQRFWECLDEELREGALRRSVANVRAMRFPALDSEFRVLSASDANAGRGLTMQNLHCSEVARWPGNASETLAGLRAALAPGGELVLESTPNGAYGCFYNEWANAIFPENRVPHIPLLRCGTEPLQSSWEPTCGSDEDRVSHPCGPVPRVGEPPQLSKGSAVEPSSRSALTRHFFPWWLEAAYADAAVTDPTPEEEELIDRHGLTLEQIGYRRFLEASHQRLRSQEFAEDPETCFRATGYCCFNVESIEARLAELGLAVEQRRGGALLLWLPPKPGKKYILGVDTAGGGTQSDFAAIQVVDLQTGLQCAELRERLKAVDLARVSAQLAREYNTALIAVERNNHGAGVLAHLQSAERYPNLYEHGGEPGWPTNSATKPLMVSRMGAILAESPQLFLSRRLLAECRTFVAFAGGRTGASNGSHDDCFMAMAVAQSVRRQMLVGMNRKIEEI